MIIMPHAQPDSLALNPAMLKLRLLAEGVEISGGGPGEFAEIEFEEGTIARARVTPGADLKWVESAARGELRAGTSGLPAHLNQRPGLGGLRTAHGVAVGDIVQVHGLFANVMLGGGCGLTDAGRTCALCRGRELTEKAGEWWSPVEVAEALRAALKNSRAEFIHFNVGYLPGDSAGLERLRSYFNAVRHYLDAMLCITMHPPADLSAIDNTYALGVDVVCYSLEAPDRESMERLFAGRARFLGRDRYMAALARAAKVFPRGATWSVILGDAAEPDVIRNAVLELASIGVVPLLGFSGGGAPTIRADAFAAIGATMFEATNRHTQNMHWTAGLATALTPFDARHLVPGAPTLPALIHQLNRNRLGAFATRILARLRRRLRVTWVETFDPSHL